MPVLRGQIEVVPLIRVSVGAVSLTRVLRCERVPAKQVLPIRDDLEMVRVDAASIPTEVIDDQSGWDRSTRQLVGHAMRVQENPTPA